MRVLHLMDEASPQSTGPTLAVLAGSLGRLGHVEQRVLLLGGPRLERMARRCGVDEVTRLGVPFGRAMSGAAAVRRWLRGQRAFDVVHCWSVGALTLACLWCRSIPKLLTITVEPSDRVARWLGVLTSESVGRIGLLALSHTLRRQLICRGVPESSVHVLRPGMDMSQVVFGQRDALRQRWGARPTDMIITAVGDPLVAVDTLAVARCVYLADGSSVTDNRRMCLLTHPLSRHRRRAEAIARNLGRPYVIIREPWLEYPWLVLPGCDWALAQGPWAGGLSLLWAMIANVPIIGDATYAVSEVLEDRHSALLTPPDSPQAVVRRMGQLLHDRQLTWKIRDTARHEAYSFFSRRHYCQSLTAAYEQIAVGEPIDMPVMEQSGGLRFVGRP